MKQNEEKPLTSDYVQEMFRLDRYKASAEELGLTLQEYFLFQLVLRTEKESR